MAATPAFPGTAKSAHGQPGRRRSRRERHAVRSQAGFTLIEIIVTLILVGILAAAGGMAIVHAIQGYMAARDNAEMTQKAQLAVSRITREIIEMINIPTDATSSTLPINNVNGNRTIGLDSGAVKMAFGTDTLANGDILIDNVNTFTLTYYSRDPATGAVTTSSTWPAANDITTLTAIDINLLLNRPGGGTVSFGGNRVAPRNNKNIGGSVPSAIPPAAPTYSGCFVATAAYGNPDHPLVQLLREFRDRFLLPWPGGQWLVRQYYAHGPAAAELIRPRPLVKGIFRALLAPVAGLTFFALYAPLALLLLLPLSLILTVALFSAFRRRRIPRRSHLLQGRGSILIGLIATMTILATLGAVLLHLFSASNLNQVYADQGRKAYFLAESGFRYAASQFLNAGNEAGRLTAMTAMNNKTCILLNNGGAFTTRVYPYWFKSLAATAGATTLSSQVYGTIPDEFTGSFAAGQIRVGSLYYSYSSGSGSGTTVTFSGLSPALPATAAAVDVQPVTQPSGAQTLSKGGTLVLSSTGAAVFPTLNGNFILYPAPAGIPNGAVFNYDKRTGNTLFNITLSDGTQNSDWTTSLSVPATTKVILDKYLRLSSTASLGTVTREVIYNVPVGWIAGGGTEYTKVQDVDPMNSAAGWSAPTGGGGGTYAMATIDGGSALQATATSSGGWWSGTGEWAMAFFSGYSSTSLAQAWLDAGGFLSYDLQVKVYNTRPYYFAGMGFRARNNADATDLYTYGVSFIKPRQMQTRFLGFGSWSAWTAPGDLATDLIPGYASDSNPGPLFSGNLETSSTYWSSLWQCRDRYGLPAIVLWKRTSAGYTWIAYRTLTTGDGIVTYTSSSKAWRLVNWSTLVVRVAEGYSLAFQNGGGTSGTGVPIREGDTIETQDKTSSARVVMTPILTGGSWATRNATGTLVLANITTGTTSIAGGVPLYVNGVQLASAAGSIVATKKNYLRVYFTRPTDQGTANAVETDNNRLANPRDSVHWPPDDLTELDAANDYVTLAQWTDYNTGIAAVASTSEPEAIIVDADLTTAAWTSTSMATDFSGDSISLMTSSSSATDTSYDDFAIQMDLMAGQGFLPPIQQ